MKKIYVILFFLFLASMKGTAGGGWIYGKGNGFFKVGQNVIYAGSFFNPDGDIIDITTVGLYTSSIYAEYGITDRLTGIAYVPFFVRSTLNEIQFNQSGTNIPGDEMNAFGDTNIGLKYGFNQDKPWVMAVSLTLGLPFGETAGGESRILQSGDGEFNQLIKFETSRSFYPKPVYTSFMVGFNNRTNGFSDEVHYGFEVGYDVFSKVTGILKFNGVSSLYNGDGGGSAGNGVFANNTEYLSITPELVYKVSKTFGITGSGGFAFAARRILAAPNWSMGVYIQF